VRSERRGFALPMAILVLALMTAGVVAAYSSTTAETVTNNAMRSQDRAYQLAEAGLQQFMVRRGTSGFCSNCVSDPAMADSEWTRVSLTGGYADVVAMRVRPAVGSSPAIFFIRSTGTDTSVKLGGAGSNVNAQRTIGEYATFATAGLKAIAAVTSLNGFTETVTGSAAPIVGADQCPSGSGGTGGTLAGLVIPPGGQYTGTGGVPSGSPGRDSTMTIDSLKKRVGIDWNAIVNNDAIPADITIPGGSYPGTFTFMLNPSYYPVIRVKTNNYSIPNPGRGILIADSNLVIPSNETWDGIILVGGRLTASGSGTNQGVALTGLNYLLPGAVNPASGVTSDNDQMANSKRFYYNSCYASNAADKLKVYFGWSNSWTDNVAVW
jgi:Tfp pilus assembly protein PilX